jgi:hypothetical protein
MYYRSYYNPFRFTPIVILPIGHAPIVILPIGKNTIGVYTENFCPIDVSVLLAQWIGEFTYIHI